MKYGLITDMYMVEKSNQKNVKVLAFGEILFDIIEGEPFLGGAPLNFAAHFARLGGESYIFSRVGNDELGKKALVDIENIGVKTAFIQNDTRYETGTVDVILSSGQPDYTIVENVAYDFIEPGIIKDDLKQFNFDILYYGTLAQRNQESRKTLRKLIEQVKFKHVFYDVNLRKNFFSREILEFSLQSCTILKLNDEEVNILGLIFFNEHLSLESFAQKIADKFLIDIVIITVGAKGCVIHGNNYSHFVK